MKKTRIEKGITIIALLLIIVVLLILAAVAISSIQNDEILSYAKNVANDYNQTAVNEQGILGGYEDFLNRYIGGSGSENGSDDVTIAEIVDEDGNDIVGEVVTTNTAAWDKYGNKIVVPVGFRIRVDSTTNNADTVTEGIVIEHGTDGNQFVWIPVGKIYTDTAKTESLAKTITLGRYSNFTAIGGVFTPVQVASEYADNSIRINYYWIEQITALPNTGLGNAGPRDLEEFITSIIGNDEAQGNGGYYLGRYEAGDSNSSTVASRTGTFGTSTEGTLVCKANQVPYNWILQSDASSKCKSMYADGYKNDGTGTFSSDLINSYAWDTAIIFIQTFGMKSNSSTYASTTGKSSVDTTAPQLTSTNRLLDVTNNPIDEQLNIFDMAGNCQEWSTETSTYSQDSKIYSCTPRGSDYLNQIGTNNRSTHETTWNSNQIAFRPLLYLGV